MKPKLTFSNLISALIHIAIADSDQELSQYVEYFRGVPGEDYPIFTKVPETSFSCDGKVVGYYADPEAGCQGSGQNFILTILI